MYVSKIFAASPLMALALCISLATILWCILLARRQRSGLDKVLTGLLGLIAIYEALRILKDSGVVTFPGVGQLDGLADFVIASLSLIAALILRVSSIDRAATKAQLRLVEANEKPAELPRPNPGIMPELKHIPLDALPLAAFAVDAHGVVCYWNSAAEMLTGWTRDEVVGQPLPFSGQGVITDKSGNELDVAVWCSPVHCATGAARGAVTIAAGKSALRAGMSAPQPAGALNIN